MYNKRKINKILIVDDSAMNRGILADMLEGQYETLEAEDGRTGSTCHDEPISLD